MATMREALLYGGAGGYGGMPGVGPVGGARGGMIGSGVQGPVVGPAQDISDILSSPITTGIGIGATLAGVPGVGLATGLGNAMAQASLAPPGQFGFSDFGYSMLGGQPVSNTLGQMVTDPMGNFQGQEQGYDPGSLTHATAPNPAAVTVSELGGPEPSGEHGDTPGSVGGDGGGTKVICTELHRQGYLPTDIYKADQLFGKKFSEAYPDAMVGYHLWAVPVASHMRKNHVLTWIISILAKPWAYHISGRPNVVGKIYVYVGIPICRIIGRMKQKFTRQDQAKPVTQG